MRPPVTYTPCATSSRGGDGNIITFAQFEEGGVLTKTCNDAESGDKSDDGSIMPPLLRKEEIDAMDYGDDSDHDIISTYMFKNICDGSQSHPNVNRREARYKICDCIGKIQLEWKVALESTRSMGKGLHKVFKTVIK